MRYFVSKQCHPRQFALWCVIGTPQDFHHGKEWAMKYRRQRYLFAIALAAIASTASAEVGLSVTGGTLGFGAHLSIPVQASWNARLGASYGTYSYNTSTSNLNYDMKARLQTIEALLDYYPGASGFRISGGLIYNGNKIDADGRPKLGSTFTVNGTTYNTATAGTVNGRIDFRSMAPYLGVGWSSSSRERGWSFTGDVGAMFQGSPRTSLSSNGCTASPVLCAQLANDLAAENRALSDKVDNYKIYPVIRAGLQYRF